MQCVALRCGVGGALGAARHGTDVDACTISHWMRCYKPSFHKTDTDSDTPNTPTSLRPTPAISSRHREDPRDSRKSVSVSIAFHDTDILHERGSSPTRPTRAISRSYSCGKLNDTPTFSRRSLRRCRRRCRGMRALLPTDSQSSDNVM